MNTVSSIKEQLRDEIFSIFEEEPKKEIITVAEYYLKDSTLSIEKKEITVDPISYGFPLENEIEGKVISIEEIKPGYAIKKSLKNEVLFIKKLNQYHIKYLLEINPSAVLTTSNIDKPLFIRNFPIFKVDFPFIGGEKIKLTFRIKEEEEILENHFYDFGLGSYYLYIHFPYDVRFQNFQDLNFYAPYIVIKNIVDRLVNVGNPKGYKVRVIFTENKYTDYIGLKKHLENQNLDRILSIINIDACGLGNEKFITISNKRKIVDSYHIKKVKELMKEIGFKIKKEPLMESVDLEEIKVPFVWFFSQPNIHMYQLKKEFINEKIPVEFASGIFYLINNMYKEML